MFFGSSTVEGKLDLAHSNHINAASPIPFPGSNQRAPLFAPYWWDPLGYVTRSEKLSWIDAFATSGSHQVPHLAIAQPLGECRMLRP